jgi:hypothetical protein
MQSPKSSHVLSSTLSLKKNWLLRSFALQYDLSISLGSFHLSLLVDGALTQLGSLILPSKVITDSATSRAVLKNLKGRDQSNLIDSAIPSFELPTTNELFFLSGLTFHQSDAETAPEELPFCWRISTPFLGFSGENAIEHALHLERRGEIPAEIPFGQLGRIFPLQPLRFRAGFDLYGHSRLGAWFAGTPSVTQTLLLEADEKILKLRISAEELRAPGSELLSSGSLFSNLCKLLKELADFDLESDLRNKRSASQ